MPRSEEKDPKKNIERLAKTHPEFPPKQRIAVAFSEARRANHPIGEAFRRLREKARGGKGK